MLLVDDELPKQINCASSVAIATATNFSYAKAGQRIATVKERSFSVAKSHLSCHLDPAKNAGRSCRPRPVRTPLAAVLYSDPVNGETASTSLRTSCANAWSAMAAAPNHALSALEEEMQASCASPHLAQQTKRPRPKLRRQPRLPVREDVVGRAMNRIQVVYRSSPRPPLSQATCCYSVIRTTFQSCRLRVASGRPNRM